MLKIHLFTFGPVQENTYILYDEESREAAIVDPGCMRHSEEEKLRDFITERGLTPTLMLVYPSALRSCMGSCIRPQGVASYHSLCQRY